MLRIVFTFLMLVSFLKAEDLQDVNDDSGWYWLNKVGFKYNYLGASATSQIYRKQTLFRDKNKFVFGRAEINYGLDFTATSYARIGAFVDFQPFSFFGIAISSTYEGAWTDLGRPVLINSSTKDYAYAVTGGPNSNEVAIRVGGNTMITTIMPYIILGAPIKQDFLVFIYRPIITIYNSFGVDSNTFLYYSTDNVVVRPIDAHYIHDILLLYSFSNYGIRTGLSGMIEHIQSDHKIWRYGIFATFIYHQPLKKYNRLIPFAAAKFGTWLMDRYFQNDFTIFAEFGFKWRFK